MGKNLAVTSGTKHLIGKKMYLTDSALVHRPVKKAYLTVGGVHRLCYGAGGGVESMGISYSGNMIDAGIVSMTDGEYRLLTLTSSGTLTVDTEASAEVWMCGGGTSGGRNSLYGGCGGGGAFTAEGKVTLSGSKAAVVGSGGAKMTGSSVNVGGISSFDGIETASISLNGDIVAAAGTGGGARGSNGGASSGDGISKYPFEDSDYFSNPHCAGGGGGGANYEYSTLRGAGGGGIGGTNGGNGGGNHTSNYNGGAGGSYGGGTGGTVVQTNSVEANGSAASFYGSGGGGGASYYRSSKAVVGVGGAGYQGVIYIRIPVNQ